jgi:hypothetical protein
MRAGVGIEPLEEQICRALEGDESSSLKNSAKLSRRSLNLAAAEKG